jgi:adhesin/invasin
MQRITTPSLQVDTTGATLGALGDYLAGTRDTLRVQIYDPTDSSGVQGISVTWATQAPTTSDGHPNNATTVTDNLGYAKTVWVLRSDADGSAIPPSNVAKRMFATASIGQVEFQVKVTAGHACSVSQNTISTSPSAGSSLADTITVLDCNGFAVPGATITLTPGGGSGSVTGSPVFTNSAGQAFTTWTLGTVAPSVQTLNATMTAQPTNPFVIPGPFPGSTRAVSVVAGAASSVAVVGVPPAHVALSGSTPITVLVTDAYGNQVAGQSVGFAASGGGTPVGTVSSAAATTGSGGTASVIWTMGGGPGPVTNTLTITAGGAVATVSIISP